MKSTTGTIILVIVMMGLGFGGVVLFDKLRSDSRQASISPENGCEHGMVGDCPFCDSSLIESMGFCQGHGVPEAFCYLCWPELVQAFKVIGDWCSGHERPESQCELCNPGVLAKYQSGNDTVPLGADGKEIVVVASEMIPPDQGARFLKKPDATCAIENLRVQFASPGTAEAAGIVTERVRRDIITRTIKAPVELKYDRTRYANIRPLAVGVVSELLVNLGTYVTKGTPLAIIDSRELSQYKADYLRLHREIAAAKALTSRLAAWYERTNAIDIRMTANAYLNAKIRYELAQQRLKLEEKLHLKGATSDLALLEVRSANADAESILNETRRKLTLFGLEAATIEALTSARIDLLEGKGTTSEQPLLEAERTVTVLQAQYLAVRDQLHLLGLSEDEVDQLSVTGDTSGKLTITAPFSGTITEVHVTVGELLSPEEQAFTLADTSTLWARLDVKEKDALLVSDRQNVVFSFAGLPGQRFSGRVFSISTAINSGTRAVEVFARVVNETGKLRAGLYGTAEIVYGQPDPALLVPKDAIQWDGCCNLVFVRQNDQLYEPRKVTLSYEADGYYLADSGLRVDEEVVTTGSFLMKTEIMKGSIGAGCCEVEPGGSD